MTSRPTIEWQVCGVCNYDCTYCIQSRASRAGQPDEALVDGLIAFFEALPGAWEIKMSGGEPFAARLFLSRVVPGLAERTRHTISVLTNFSAPLAELERFAELARGRLGIVSASLHLERTTASAFVAKAAAFVRLLDPATQFVVNSVLVPGRLGEAEEAKRVVEGSGFRYFPQVMKDKSPSGVVAYDESDRARVTALVGREGAGLPLRANTAPSYRGRLCRAGGDYFVLTQTGDAWSCRTAKRYGQGSLGNVLQGGIRLRADPSACAYDICPCTVPANRGMIAGVAGS